MTRTVDLARRAARIWISDHVVRRYFERVKGIVLPFGDGDDAAVLWWIRSAGMDVEGARREIERIVAPAAAAGATSVKCANIRFMIDEKTKTVATLMLTARSK